MINRDQGSDLSDTEEIPIENKEIRGFENRSIGDEEREEQKSNKGSDTETDSEFDIKDDNENYQNIAGLELPNSLIRSKLDKFVSKIGINSTEFRKTLESPGGPLENGKIRPPAPSLFINPEPKKPSSGKWFNNSPSGTSNDGSINIKSESKKIKKQTYWKPDEDLKLKELHDKYGNQWMEIQKFFPDKTKEQIHNHIRHLRKSGKLELIGTKDYEKSKRKKGKTTIKINLFTGELLDKNNTK